MRFHYNNYSLSSETINKIIKKNNSGIDHSQRKNFTRIMLDGKMYFVKTINVSIKRYSGESNTDNEIKPSIQFVNLINKYNKYSILFSNLHAILQTGYISYYIMDDIKNGDLSDMLPLFNQEWIDHFLLQSLIGIYILNHKIKLFHNDIYYKDVIRNVMVHKNNKMQSDIDIKVTLDNNNICVPIKEYCIKIIDLGRSCKRPEFRTTEYHQKYFPTLKYISEPLLFTYFFFKTMNDDKFDIINKIINNIESSKTLKEFDEKFILEIIKKLKIKTNE